MRTEQYSTGLVTEIIRAQAAIEAEHSYVTENYFSKAGRGARITNANRRVDRILADLEKRTNSYYDSEFTQVYRSGYEDGSKKVREILKGAPEAAAPPISGADRSYLARQRAAGKAEMSRAIAETRTRSRAFMSSKEPLPGSSEMKTVEAGNRLYKLDTFGNLAINGRASDAYNRGSLASAADKGFDEVLVVDGPSCGWTSHDDGDLANNKVVTIEEARAHTRSHPYCVREFVPNPGDKHPKIAGTRAKKIAKGLAIGAAVAGVAAGGAVLYQNRVAILTAINRVLLSNTPEWKQWDLQIRAIERELEQAISSGGDLIDIRTGRTLSTRPIDIAQRALDDAVNFEQRVDAMGDYTRRIIGITDRMDRVEATAKIRRFNEFVKTNQRANMTDRLVSSIDEVESLIRSEFVDEVVNMGSRFNDTMTTELRKAVEKTKVKIVRGPSDRIVEKMEKLLPDGNLFRLSLPRIEGGDGFGWIRSLRGRIDAGRFLRVTGTQKLGGQRVGSLLVNRNGLLRMGFQYGKDGVLYPRLSIVPKAPIRLLTRLNRGVDGNINSLSGQIRILVPGPFNPQLNFNVDLRSLLLQDLWDIRNVTMKDLAGLGWDNFRIRSLALESKFRLMNNFDVSDVLRIKWEDAKSLFTKSDFILTESGVVERRIGAMQKLKIFEARYFGDFAEDAAGGFSKFRDVAGGQFRRYYAHKLEELDSIVRDARSLTTQIVQEEFERQRGIIQEDWKTVRRYTDMMGKFIKDFDPKVANEWIRAQGAFSYDVFAAATRQVPKSVVNNTVATLRAVHNKIFVELPAARRRRMFRLLGPWEEGAGADMLGDIVRGMSWKEKFKAWGSDLYTLANEHGISTEGASHLLERVGRSIGEAYRGLNGYSKGMGRDELSRVISRHTVNAKKKIQDVVDWNTFLAKKDQAVEAAGDFGQWVESVMKRSRRSLGRDADYEEVFKKSVDDLRRITGDINRKFDKKASLRDPSRVGDRAGRVLLRDEDDLLTHLKGDLGDGSLTSPAKLRKDLGWDYRDIEIPDVDDLLDELSDKGIIIEGEGLPFEGENYEKMLKIIKNMADNFGMDDVKIIDLRGPLSPQPDLPGDYGGMYWPRYNKVGIIPSVIRGNAPRELVEKIWDAARSGHHSKVRAGDEFVGTLQHELGHRMDLQGLATYRHSQGLIQILKEEIPGLILPDSDLAPELRRRMDLFDERLARGKLPLDMFHMNEVQQNNYLYLWRITSLNAEEIQDRVSLYGSTQPVEMVAELFRHAMLADNPSHLSLRVVKWLTELAE